LGGRFETFGEASGGGWGGLGGTLMVPLLSLHGPPSDMSDNLFLLSHVVSLSVSKCPRLQPQASPMAADELMIFGHALVFWARIQAGHGTARILGYAFFSARHATARHGTSLHTLYTIVALLVLLC
jgi:hypothetical protein